MELPPFWPVCLGYDESVTDVFSLISFMAAPHDPTLLLALESQIFSSYCICSHSNVV